MALTFLGMGLNGCCQPFQVPPAAPAAATEKRLSTVSPVNQAASGAAAPPAPTITGKPPDDGDRAVMRELYGFLPTARLWAFYGHTYAILATDYLAGRDMSVFKDRAETPYQLCRKYFHLENIHPAHARAALARVRELLGQIIAALDVQVAHVRLGRPERTWFQVDPTTNNVPGAGGALMFTAAGGLHDINGEVLRSGVSAHGIYVATKKFARFKGQAKAARPREWGAYYRDWMVLCVVHELAHFVGPGESGAILDFGTRHADPDRFAALTRSEALRNADTYARFCNACAPGTSIPFGYYPNWR